jgi:hypothetical protein
MSLYQKLQKARSEEDVKDAYIKALGLKGYSKNLIDIQTKEIWFEAKDNAKHQHLRHVYPADALCAAGPQQRRIRAAVFVCDRYAESRHYEKQRCHSFSRKENH